jgi:hypothetical protein
MCDNPKINPNVFVSLLNIVITNALRLILLHNWYADVNVRTARGFHKTNRRARQEPVAV